MIRHEQTDGDYKAVSAVHRAAFAREVEARLVETLRRADGFDPRLSLVAVEDGRIVGHILFSPIRIKADDGTATPAVALAPMAVLPECQRRGIGSGLVRHGLEACRAAGHRIVIVLGHAEYYPRFGFRPAGPFGIRAPFDVRDDVFMVLALVAGALHGVTGAVRYPRAFHDL